LYPHLLSIKIFHNNYFKIGKLFIKNNQHPYLKNNNTVNIEKNKNNNNKNFSNNNKKNYFSSTKPPDNPKKIPIQ
jgi:hypothetical protein